jgi:hypothetical protein
MPEIAFSIPEDLIQAIQISSFERQLPKQGDSCVHRYLIDSSNETLQKPVEEWIEYQKSLWPKVDKIVRRLHSADDFKDGSDHPWVYTSWWMSLCMPWSSDLSEAIRSAEEWCDAQSS